MKRRTIVLISGVAVVLAIAAAAVAVARPKGVQIGDCLSHVGYQQVACDAGKNQIKIVSVGIVGCDSANRLRVLVKDHQSYCAVDTRPPTPAVVNEGDCVKKSTASGSAAFVKTACTEADAHKVVKKVAGSTNKADCPATAPNALVSTSQKYVLCFTDHVA
jgi:hypothetical protein